jgi:hypothetical protein
LNCLSGSGDIFVVEEEWLVRHVTILGVPFQNWMLITFVLILVGVLINWGERRP